MFKPSSAEFPTQFSNLKCFFFCLDEKLFVMKEALITLLISKALISTISVITAASMLIVLIVRRVRLEVEDSVNVLNFQKETPLKVLHRGRNHR